MGIDITKLIGKTTDYGKKQELEISRPKNWCKSVSAFANGQGGRLIFGVRPDAGPVQPQMWVYSSLLRPSNSETLLSSERK